MTRRCGETRVFLAAVAAVALVQVAVLVATVAAAAVVAPGAQAPFAPQTAVAIMTPDVDPRQIDFGEAWDGDVVRKFVTLKSALADGNIVVSAPADPFRIIELRVLGLPPSSPSSQALKGQGAARFAPNPSVISPLVVLSRITAPPWQAFVQAGQQVQVAVAFQPKFDFFSMPAGPKTSSLRLQGPGTRFPWVIPISLQGRFDGIRLGAALIILDRDRTEPQSSAREEGFPVIVSRVRLAGTGQRMKGEFRVQQPRYLVARAPVIDLGPSDTREVDVHLLGTITPFTPVDVTLAFNFQRQDGTKGSSTGSFRIFTYTDSFRTSVSGPTLCGFGVEWWQPWESGDSYMVTVRNNGQMELSLPFWNRTLDTRNVKISLSFSGVPGTFFNQTVAVTADKFAKHVLHDTFPATPGTLSPTYYKMYQGSPTLQCGQ